MTDRVVVGSNAGSSPATATETARATATMKIVSVHLPEAYVEAIDELVKAKLYPNRAEAIRMAVRDFVRREHTLLATLQDEVRI